MTTSSFVGPRPAQLLHPTVLRLTLAGLLLWTQMGWSQPIKTGPDRPLDAPTRTKVVEELMHQLTAQYVFPAVADQIRQSVQGDLVAGRYDSITSCNALADTLTARLQDISHDKHLRLFYHNQAVPPAENQSKADEQAALYEHGRQINFGIGAVRRLAGNIGYIRVDEFMPVELAAKTATAAMTEQNSTDALILDLRQNRGGEPAMVAFLASYFFGPDSVHLTDIVRRGGVALESFWTHSPVPGKPYGGKPLYILTSRRTFSAGEEFAYDLQSLKRATVVGEPTAGGAHAGELIWISEHFTAFIPVEYARNPVTQTNWEGTGVQPDIATSQDQALQTAHLAALEILAESASERKRKAIRRLIAQLRQSRPSER